MGSEQANVEVVQSLYQAFGRGDIGFILDHLTDDVHWITHLEPNIPWHGDFNGKQNVPRFFQAIGESGEVLGFDPEEFVSQGDTVVSMGYFEYRSNATRRSARTKWVFIWRFRDGKVSSYEQFHDPALSLIF